MADTKHPDGSWKISFKGMRATSLQEIANTKDIPQPWKDVLTGEVNAFPESVQAVRVDAHCHFSGGKKVLHADIQPLF